ncbi:MAG TPA: AAA family ATPase [Polyangiaceae bacterium]|nr:AAA family ATPase [Polyangiaceae bacterium]
MTRIVGPHRRALVEKTLEPGHQDPDTVAALIHEAAVLERIAAPGVEKLVALRTIRALPVLIVEDAGPATLRDRGRRPFEVDAFVDLAIRLAEIVAHVHGCDVIHRDINPSNIVLDDVGAPTLVDFDRALSGSASVQVARDEVGGEPPLLPYASPEQLGRTARLVDRRSDLYSLGTVFYEMLTGAPPFRSDDPLEIVHAHLARLPISPTVVAAGVPALVSGIVLKLLSKTPEARYQTGAALAVDLREARARWQKTGAIEPFELGSLDLALELPMPDRLYGRAAELAAMRAAMDRVVRGGRELVLVSGDAGIGKSALVESLRDEVVSGVWGRGRFFSGKFDLRAANVPFASLVEALRGLVKELKQEPGDLPQASRARILSALGDNGRVLTELLPELEELIGVQPALPALEPFEAQTRLYVTLQSFVQAFASEDRPLVLFLDDLQWADAGSLDALRALACDPESRYLLLLSAYRPRDVAPAHPLAHFEEELRRGRIVASRVDLAPLDREAVQDLLGEALRTDPARTAPLAELLTRKTGGNPFFLRQLIASLHRSGQLAFDLRERRWTWNLQHIERVGITENVVELLLDAIRRLPDEARELLPTAACVGKRTAIGLLADVTGLGEARVCAALLPAVREGLLLVDPASGAYQFAHDRVQDAAYSMLSEARRDELHLRIGRVLVSRAGTGIADTTFDAADHLNAGASALGTDAERLDLARLDHRAGLKAKASAAFGPALAYLRAGLAAMPADAWETHDDLAMLMLREAAECAYLSGDYALSDTLVEEGLGRATAKLQKADLYNLRVVSAASRAAWQEAIEQGQHGLQELGYTVATEPDMESAIAEEERALGKLLDGRGPLALLDLPALADPTDLAILRLLVNLGHPAWWFRDRGLFRLLSFRALRFVAERGHAPESLTALCNVAMCLSAQDQFEASDAYGAVAQTLAPRFPHHGQQAHAQILVAVFVQRWRQPYDRVLPRLLRAAENAKRVGEMRGASYALSARVAFAFAAGHELDDVLRDVVEDMPFLRRTRSEGIIAFHLCYRQAIRCLKGLTSARNQFSEPGFDENAFLRAAEVVPSLVCLYWIRRLHTSFVFRDFVAAHGYAEAAGQLMDSMAGFVPAVDYLPYCSLCLTALCETGPAGKRAEWLARIADNQRRLARWSESCSASFFHLYLLVEAELARLDDRPAQAADLYEKAIEQACEGGFVHDAAVASELAGRHARARGRTGIGDLYIRKARERYARWGAAEKVRALEEEFPELGRTDHPVAGGLLRDADLDILSLLKSAETISTEVVLDRLLERLIHVCAEAAGADRVAVILEEDGKPFVRASGMASGRVELDRFPLAEGVPVARHAIEQARSTRRPMAIDDAVHDPRVAVDPYVTSRAMKSILALPVQRGATLVATLYFENNLVSHAFTGPRLQVLELLSAQIAAALENSLLFEKLTREVGDRRRAEDSVRFLANVGAELSETLDATQISGRLARLIVPAMADWCCVDVLDDGREIHRLAAVHADPAKAALMDEFRLKGVPDWSSPQPPSVALRSGTPFVLEEVTESVLRTIGRDAEHLRLARGLGVGSVVAMPMIAHGRTVGVLSLVRANAPAGPPSTGRRRFGADDLTVIQEIAQRAAFAIDNARLFQKAQDAVRVREEFLSVAAHELHTPITSLHLMMQALSTGGVPVTPDTVRQTFGVADRQVRRLIRLIDELLDVSRIEAHHFHFDFERLDLGGLVREVVERFGDDARRAGSSLRLRIAEAVPGVWDRGRLEQVVSNLLSNAVKFGAGRPIEIAVSGSPDRARLAVVDQGIGVPAGRVAHIFDRFERGVSSQQYGGLGLGLYIVRTIVETLGGEVRCEDTPGGGATFLVDLPRERDGQPDGQHCAAAATAEGRT